MVTSVLYSTSTRVILVPVLDQRIAAAARLEPLGGDLSICCFRYRGDDNGDPADQASLNAVNRAILKRLVAEGRVFMSPTELDGRYALRVCIVNFRTTRADIDLLVDAVLRIGDEVVRRD